MMLFDLDPYCEGGDTIEGAPEEVEPPKDKGLCSVMTPSVSTLNTKSCAYESTFFILSRLHLLEKGPHLEIIGCPFCCSSTSLCKDFFPFYCIHLFTCILIFIKMGSLKPVHNLSRLGSIVGHFLVPRCWCYWHSLQSFLCRNPT